MRSLVTIVSWMIGFFLAGLIVSILVHLLRGHINTRGLLYGRMSDGSRYLSPERVQLMIFTLWVGLFYLLDTFETRVAHPTPTTAHTLPEIETETLALLGGSQTVYLIGKAYAMLIAKRQKGI